MKNRQIVLIDRPEDIPVPQNFRLVERDYPELPKDGLIVRNHFLSIDPAMRGWICDPKNYLPPVPIDSVMRSLAVGEVVAASSSDEAIGEFVTGWFGWQDFAAVKVEAVIRKVLPSEGELSASLGILGINGITAYQALNTIGRLVKGDTVVVSTAAGSVGSIVGQLACQAGCKVIGLTGSDEKVKRCVKHFGYSAAVNYKNVKSLSEAVASHAKQGVDVFFDNTAGEIADSIFPLMNLNGRVIQCGTASISSWGTIPVGPRRERHILTKRLLLQGFVVFDHMQQWPKIITALSESVRKGDIYYREDIREGLLEAPKALSDLYLGKNQGKTIIKLL